MQTLTRKGSSGIVTLPKDYLLRDDVLEDGDVPEEQNLVVDRLGRRAYLVRLVDDGTIPDPEQTEVVERLAARRMMQQDAFGNPKQSAD